MQRLPQDPGYPLITRERSDKLDLLQHLTANLARTVIVCGPEGVGKTRLLTHFQGLFTESSLLCALKGESQISFEKIQGLLSETITQKIPGYQAMSLASALEKLPNQDSFVLLLIDDAGKLAPGVMGRIISYAEQYPALRIVFAMTHSDLFLKNGTDPAIDDCYQIEIPPLTELQCADFLEYLSTLPNPRIDFNAINEVFVADLYRESHGIPGKILDKLPQPNNAKKLDYSSPILIGAVIALVAIALGVQWWSSRPKPVAQAGAINKPSQEEIKQTEVAKPQVPVTLPAQPQQVPNPAAASTASSSTVAGQQQAVTENPTVKTEASAQTNLKAAQEQPPAVPAQPAGNAVNAAPTPTPSPVNLDEGGQWVMKQPAENVTLQLMALSDQEAIINVMQKHEKLGLNLIMLKTTTKRGKDRFVLLYGSFANSEQASTEAKNLPGDLRKTWTRKMSAIQAELNPASPSSPPSLINTPQ
jgi:DamX protein